MKSYLVDKKILPDMKETRRNVSWHAGEDNYGETGSTIFDSKGISPEMTLCSCLLLTFSHAKKCPSLWKSPNTSCLDGVRTSCSHTLLQISGDVPLWCPTKIEVPLWYCKMQEISLALLLSLQKDSNWSLQDWARKEGGGEKVCSRSQAWEGAAPANRTQTSQLSGLTHMGPLRGVCPHEELYCYNSSCQGCWYMHLSKFSHAERCWSWALAVTAHCKETFSQGVLLEI